MVSILKDLGIMEYEPRVLNQLLEFAYRYMTTILDDAKMVSSHAKKKVVDVDDIKLAVQVRLTSFQISRALCMRSFLNDVTVWPLPVVSLLTHEYYRYK